MNIIHLHRILEILGFEDCIGFAVVKSDIKFAIRPCGWIVIVVGADVADARQLSLLREEGEIVSADFLKAPRNELRYG